MTTKKTKWYWQALHFILFLGLFGGVRVLLFQDIPLLLFLGVFLALFMLPNWFGWLKWWNKLLWSLGVTAVTLAVVAFVIPPFPISPRTTYLTEPLATDFYGIDYAAAMEGQLVSRIPPGENGVRLLVETFGKSLFDEKLETEPWERLCRYFDLPADIEPKLKFVSLWDYAQNLEEAQREIIEKAWDAEDIQPWPEEAMPIVERWSNENDEALNVFFAAMEMPVLFAPPIFDGQLYAKNPCDEICQAMMSILQARIRYWLAAGESDPAWEDVLTMYQIGEKHRAGVWCVTSSLMNNYFASRADRCAEAVMLGSDWEGHGIRGWVERIAEFQKPLSEEEIRFVLRGERLMFLNLIQRMADGDFYSREDSEEEMPAVKRFWLKIMLRLARMEESMAKANRRFDETERRILSDEPWPEAEKKSPGSAYAFGLAAWYGPFGIFSVISDLMADLYFFDEFESWRMSLEKRRDDAVLTRLVLALEACAREYDGIYPAPDDLWLIWGWHDILPAKFRYELKPAEDGRPGFVIYEGEEIRRQVPGNADAPPARSVLNVSE